MNDIHDCKAQKAGTAPKRARDRDRNRLYSMAKQAGILPRSLPPRGLSRVQAAEYIGVSPSLFDQMVADGRMPKPKRINGRTVWDRMQIDEAFAALSDMNDKNPWD